MNMSSSLTGPAVMPSGGSLESMRYSLKRRFEADEAMVCIESGGARKVAAVLWARGAGLLVYWVWVVKLSLLRREARNRAIVSEQRDALWPRCRY
jgi:hypothetical protein